jgi:multidrug efflux pump
VPGAQVVAECIAAPIEQQVNGVEEMLYMSSQSTSDGSYTLTVTFRLGVDLNLAQVLVQNRVALAMPLLPDVVEATGVVTKKRSPDILLVASVISPDGRYDQLYLSNYALMHIRDQISRLPGISEVLLFGQPRLCHARLGRSRTDERPRHHGRRRCSCALQEQNVQVSAGQIGAAPTSDGAVATQMVLTTLGRLSEISQYEDVVVKKGHEGRLVRMKDIARVEMGARSVDINNRYGNKDDEGTASRNGARAEGGASRLPARIERWRVSAWRFLLYPTPTHLTPLTASKRNSLNCPQTSLPA